MLLTGPYIAEIVKNTISAPIKVSPFGRLPYHRFTVKGGRASVSLGWFGIASLGWGDLTRTLLGVYLFNWHDGSGTPKIWWTQRFREANKRVMVRVGANGGLWHGKGGGAQFLVTPLATGNINQSVSNLRYMARGAGTYDYRYIQ